MKLLDRKRMAKRAWGSTSCALILTGFVIFYAVQAALGDLGSLFWFVVLLPSLAAEWISSRFWKDCDLRAPMVSGVNQFWLGVLAAIHMIWDAYHPDAMGWLQRMPMGDQVMSIVRGVNYDANWFGAIVTFFLQVLVAYQFWSGGPRGYRPLSKEWRLRNPGPASDRAA